MNKILALLFFNFSLVILWGERVLPVESISYLRILKKADFDQRFPGLYYQDRSQVPHGMYLQYDHERLLYLFGPISQKTTAEFYADELREIFQDALLQRPSLSSASIQIVTLPEEPVESSQGNAPNEKEIPADGQPVNTQSEEKPSQPAPAPKRNPFLEWLFSIFS